MNAMSQPETLMDRRVYSAGEVIFQEGAQANSCAFLVESGSVEILKGTPNGHKKLGTIGPGGIFGEMALIDAAPRMAMARAGETTTVRVLTQALFDQKLRRLDPLLQVVFQVLAKDIRQMTEEVMELAR